MNLNENYSAPYFVFSKAILSKNVDAYLTSLGQLSASSMLNFSLKANYNPHLIKVTSVSVFYSHFVVYDEFGIEWCHLCFNKRSQTCA